MNAPGPSGPPTIQDDLHYLEGFGFVVVAGEHAGREPEARLLVSLRDHPTLEHFDPEWVLAWETRNGRGVRVRIDRDHLPAQIEFSWGTIRVYDRLDESNTFVTFGGTVHTLVLSPRLSVVRFTSPAPILRWAGHSQPIDPRAVDVESFFARMMIPIDFVPGAEAIVNAATPFGRYAAMVADFASRMNATGSREAWRRADPEAGQWAAAERNRLRTEHPDTWAEGNALLQRLGISRR